MDAGTEGGGEGGASEAGPAPIAGLRLFFSDLTSGPGTGGQNGKGAFVTVYGNGFGASQGTSTVTVGGGAADNYPIWTNTKITFQLGAAAQTGNIVVNVGSKGASNGLPFTVRSGNIFFVSKAGSDTANDGSYAKPWATIPKAKNTIAAGDIAYIGTSAGDAVSQTAVDSSSSYDCALGMSTNDGTNAGTEAMPKALVAYPGATATIGVVTGLEHGILTPAITGTFDYWVIAGFVLRGLNEAIDMESTPVGWRIVGNDISCPNGSGESGCVTGMPTDLKFFGNVVHDAAANVTTVTKYYHGVYWGSSHIEMGWNVVRDGKTCRGIQFHDTGGPNEFDLHVHDNVIHDTVCDGLSFATVDPSQGTVEAYNNVIYHVGTGPDPADGASDYACIYVAGETDMGAAGGGTVELFNNTLYDCGPGTHPSDCGSSGQRRRQREPLDALGERSRLRALGRALRRRNSVARLGQKRRPLRRWRGALGLHRQRDDRSAARERRRIRLPPDIDEPRHRRRRLDFSHHRLRRQPPPPGNLLGHRRLRVRALAVLLRLFGCGGEDGAGHEGGFGAGAGGVDAGSDAGDAVVVRGGEPCGLGEVAGEREIAPGRK